MLNFIILLSIIFSSTAQMFLKLGAVRILPFGGSKVDFLISLMSPYILGGIMLHVCSLAVWLYILKRVDLSYAYPFLAMGFVLTTLIGYFFLGENVGFGRIAGISFIVLGVLCIAYAK